MPEISEIARIVHFLNLHLVGARIKTVLAVEDANVFGKVGTTGPEFVAALTGRKVISAGQQGKYFWLVLDKPPHPVMHFGMTGWIHIKGELTAYTNYYKKMKEDEMDIWPPKYWKFQLRTEDDPAVEIAFTDPRRFGRVRLVDAPGDSIRKASPLVENGPDPVVDSDLFTEDYLRDKMRSRHVPVKALILDQAMISGIGNWVGDEVLYHAKLHPEQYCDDFDDEQIHALYESIRYVCTLAVEKLGDSDAFPDHWLFNHRWGKGTKTASSHLPNGQKLAFLTVGGRTSCFAPSVQKKTGRLVRGVKEEAMDSDADGEASTAKGMRDESEAGINVNGKAMKKRKSANAAEVKCDAKISKIIASKTVGEADSVPGETPAPKGKSLKTTQRKSRSSVKEKIRDPENLTTPRRSGRLQGRSEFFED